MPAGVLPNSPLRGVSADAEEVIQVLLGGVDLGEHAPRTGSSSLSLVEHQGLLDVCQAVEEFPNAHMHAGMLGFADHEPGDQESEHAVEDVHVDLLLAEVKHRRERDDPWVLHLAKVCLDGFLGAVLRDDLSG